MGLGGGTGAGIDPFITNKQIAFMGDSTFFHSGMIAISDSIKHRQDITYIILDNKTTAMTGHQPTPGSDVDIMGSSTVAQDIEAIIKGMTLGMKISVVRVNPAYRETYRALIETLVLQDKDEFYVAHLLTSPEKLERDKERYDVDEKKGDRIEYIHFTRPRFRVFGKTVEVDWKAKPWQLRLIKRMKFLRRVLPGWHKEERAFRDWYRGLVAGFTYHDVSSYKQYVMALRVPEGVTGCRHVRYPKMERARRFVEGLLKGKVPISTEDNVLNKESRVAVNLSGDLPV